jgi:membrane dipeptidase
MMRNIEIEITVKTPEFKYIKLCCIFLWKSYSASKHRKKTKKGEGMNIQFMVFLLMICTTVKTITADSERKPSNLSQTELIAQAKQIHEQIITIDTHVDILPDFATPKLNPGIRQEKSKVDLVKMKEGGLDAVFFASYVLQKKLTPENYSEAYNEAINKIKAIRRMCEEMNPDLIELALTPDDVTAIKKKGKRIAIIGLENGFALGENISRIQEFYDLGVRYITITHMGYNQLGDSSDPKDDIPNSHYGGLSGFGKQVIAEMNRLGMMIDVSHISIDSFNDIITLSKAPVIASHSGCRALCNVTRNINDDQLKALKKNGGVIQIVALDKYVAQSPKGANLQTFVDHIDHVVNLIGIDHVGIGSDFDGGAGIPGFADASECLNVTVELLRRGYSREDIEKIWGGNLLRVWSDVEKVSSQKQ